MCWKHFNSYDTFYFIIDKKKQAINFNSYDTFYFIINKKEQAIDFNSYDTFYFIIIKKEQALNLCWKYFNSYDTFLTNLYTFTNTENISVLLAENILVINDLLTKSRQIFWIEVFITITTTTAIVKKLYSVLLIFNLQSTVCLYG